MMLVKKETQKVKNGLINRKTKLTLMIAAMCFGGIMSTPVMAAQVFNSGYTQEIHGHMPYFSSIGAILYQATNGAVYDAAANEGAKAVIKVGDTLRVPTHIEEAAYNQFYTWADADGTGTVGDTEHKANINLSFEWYLLESGATTIVPGVNAKLLTTSDGVTVDTARNGAGYVVGVDALNKQIGFRVKAYSVKGVPNEGVYLDVPNVAYLGQQVIDETDPSVPPTAVPPGPETENPNIDNKPVAPGAKYIVDIIDVKTNQPLGNNKVYVNREYKAVIRALNEAQTGYDDVTETMEKYLTWSVYSGNSQSGYVAQVENMTHQGLLNITGDINDFDPDSPTYTEDTKVQSRFTSGDNTTFKTQDLNANALDQVMNLPPHFSEQGLQLRVNLILPDETTEAPGA
ncbi:hypothetical protein [Thorsellia anophelis]|uniref:Uncharacterized protein n=1 Tax=Thorsellia anophelis DSM 18579 TaxID=1123402 RepID=A0A1I0C970_9GAMM|nr:hypothetical protein [Thorsellia anophelis]SET16111.1 hypothetical protein SAMN02583745_01532 [Thorsellia anophelis DSM 18579]